MTDIEYFLAEVMPEVPGCPNAIAKNAVRNALIEFCSKSTLIRKDVDPVTVVATEKDYDIDIPSGYGLVEIVWAGYNAKELTRKTEAQLASISSSWATDTGTPVHYFPVTNKLVRLWRTPQVTLVDGLTMRIALKPSPTATEFDDELYEDWHEAIAYGTLGRLMAMQGKPWTNINGANGNLLMFANKVAEAKTVAEASRHRHVKRQVAYGGIA